MSASKCVLLALDSHEMQSGGTLRGIVAYQAEHPHLRLEMCMIDEQSAHPGRTLRHGIASTRPDGVLANIFWPGARRDVSRTLPLVNISDFSRSRFPAVLLDQKRIGALSADYLLAQGLAHFAFASVKGRGWAGVLRWQGFSEGLRRAGRRCHLFDDAFPARAQDLEDGDLRAWVAQLPKPVGIHAIYLHLGLRIIWACRELGLHVPRDVAVVGGQDYPVMATACPPTLSGIAFDRFRLGYEGLRLLDRLLHGARPSAKPVLLPPEGIVQRQSSDRRGMCDPEVAAVRTAIAEKAGRPLVVKELLAYTRLSRSALERRFERQMGHSLRDEIMAAHLTVAKRLLLQTMHPPWQVALQSGFASYRPFVNAFRKQMGQTPSDYRKRSQSNV